MFLKPEDVIVIMHPLRHTPMQEKRKQSGTNERKHGTIKMLIVLYDSNMWRGESGGLPWETPPTWTTVASAARAPEECCVSFCERQRGKTEISLLHFSRPFCLNELNIRGRSFSETAWDGEMEGQVQSQNRPRVTSDPAVIWRTFAIKMWIYLHSNLTAAAIMLDEEGKFKHLMRVWLQRGRENKRENWCLWLVSVSVCNVSLRLMYRKVIWLAQKNTNDRSIRGEQTFKKRPLQMKMHLMWHKWIFCGSLRFEHCWKHLGTCNREQSSTCFLSF